MGRDSRVCTIKKLFLPHDFTAVNSSLSSSARTRDGCPLSRGARVKHTPAYAACTLCSCAAGALTSPALTHTRPDVITPCAQCPFSLRPLPAVPGYVISPLPCGCQPSNSPTYMRPSAHFSTHSLDCPLPASPYTPSHSTKPLVVPLWNFSL